MKSVRYFLGFVFTAVSTVSTFDSHAAIIHATYQVTASDFLDSNFNPPDAPSSNFVEGIYSFTFDTALPSQNEITPDSVIGLDITNNDGVVTDYNETNSGVNTSLNTFLDTGRITIGGNTSSVAFMVGLSNDFRFQFDISLTDFSVTNIFENLVYVTTVDPFYSAKNTSVVLISADVWAPAVPVPAALPLFLSGLFGLMAFSKRRKQFMNKPFNALIFSKKNLL